MKKFSSLLFCFVSFSVFAQMPLTFTFEDTTYGHYVYLDTVSFNNNIWQVGVPHKTVFTSAQSLPFAMVTDTLNPYPVNDTSVFYIKFPAWKYGQDEGHVWQWVPFIGIDFEYQLDIDTDAIAKVEVSLDSAGSWINIQDSLPPGYFWYSGFSTFIGTASTTHWERVQFQKTHFPYSLPDSAQFRFTFISGSHPSGKDGWIIDDININYYQFESVGTVENSLNVSIYPNPSNGNIYIHSDAPIDNAEISITNMQGQEVYRTNKFLSNSYLNLPLADGIYLLKCKTQNASFAKQIVIKR